MSGPIGRVVIETQVDLSGYNKSVGQLEKDAEQTTGRLNKLFGGLGGKDMVSGIAAGANQIKDALYGIGSTFDDAFDTIRIGTGATGEQLEGLSEDFRQVFGSVPVSSEEAATAIADLNTRLGLTGKPLQEMATQFLNLSRITGVDLSTAIAKGTRVFGDWGIETDKQAETLDYLFKVSQSTGIGVDSLMTKVVQFGAPLRQMGFSFEETAALLGKWEKEGVNAELAMGSMRIALGKLAQEGVQDTHAALTDLIKQIQEAGSTGDATALAMEYFGSRAGPDMAAAIREGRFSVEDLMASLSASGETINGLAADTDDFAQSWQVYSNKALLFFEPVSSAVFNFASQITPAISTVGALGTGITGLQQAGLPVISTIGKVGGAALEASKAIFNMGNVTKVASGIQAAFNVVLSANPIGLVVLAIAALTAGIILAYQHSETFRNIVNGAFGALRTTVEPVVSWFTANFIPFFTRTIPDAFRATAGFISDVWNGIKTFLDDNWKGILAIAATLLTGPLGLVVLFTTNAFGIRDKVVGAFTELKDKALGLVTDLRDGAIDRATRLKDDFVQRITGLKDAAVDNVTKLRDTATALVGNLRDWVLDRATQLKDGTVQRVMGLKDAALGLFAAFRDEATNRLEESKNNILGRLTDLKDGSIQRVRNLKDDAVALFTGLRDDASNRMEDAKRWVLEKWDALQNGLNGVKTRIADALLWPFSNFRDNASGIMRAAGNFVITKLNQILAGLEAFAGAFANGLNAITNTLGLGNLFPRPSFPRVTYLARGTDNFPGGWAIVGEQGPELVYLGRGSRVIPNDETTQMMAGADISGMRGVHLGVGGIGDVVKGALGKVGNFVGDIADTVKNWASKGAQWVVDQFLGGISLSLDGNFARLGQELVRHLLSAATDFVSELLRQAQDKVQEAVAGDAGGWVLPLKTYVVTQEFGKPLPGLGYNFHTGIDLAAARGTPIYAAGGGTVYAAGYDYSDYSLGYYVGINHADGYQTLYGHMWRQPDVRAGQQVAAGQKIGGVDSTGYSFGDHLHFMVRKNGQLINPRQILAFARGGVINEPVVGLGMRSGSGYLLGESGPEEVTPLGAGGRRAVEVNFRGPVTINAESERAAVRSARRVGWGVSEVLRQRGR